MPDNRTFWRVLLVVVVGALALRVGYETLATRTEPVLGDQTYCNAQANTIARGHAFNDFRDGSQQAEHPPLTALALIPVAGDAPLGLDPRRDRPVPLSVLLVPVLLTFLVSVTFRMY